MDQPFLRSTGGEDFIANPFTGSVPSSGHSVDATPVGPVSRFDLSDLLGGPADISAMQQQAEMVSGPLNLDIPIEVPTTVEDAATLMEPASAMPLLSGDEIAELISMALDHGLDHVEDRSAFCEKLGHTIAGFLAAMQGSESTRTPE